jgi:hypothetical protein
VRHDWGRARAHQDGGADGQCQSADGASHGAIVSSPHLSRKSVARSLGELAAGGGLLEAQRQHRLASSAAHRRETRLLTTQALHERRTTAWSDRTAALWAAGFASIERGAIGDDIAETGSLLSRHQGVPPAGFCLLRGCGM